MFEDAGIPAASETLRDLLQKTLDVAVTLHSPGEIQPVGGARPAACVWLYRVSHDASRRNVRDLDAPLPGPSLLLHYLITPAASNPADRQRLLGGILLALHQTPILQLAGGRRAEVVCESLPLGDLARLWTALQQPMQVSAAFQVKLPA